MAEITLSHDIETDEDTFWNKILFDEGFNKKLFEGHLKMVSWKETDRKEDDAKIVRVVDVHPPPMENLPGPLKKALGDRVTYKEEGTFDKKTKRYSFKILPSTLADKTKVTGELWLEKLDGKKVRRKARINVEVKVFVIGGMLEERILNETKKSYDEGAVFTNAFLRENAL